MTFAPVTKDEFFAYIRPRDVHPRSEPEVTYWELRNRQVVGKSTPGWLLRGARQATQFFLARAST
jgi:hypothetical protein